MVQFKIMYGETEYIMNSFIGSYLIEELYYMEKDKENIIINLTLYKDIFIILFENLEFKYDTIEDIRHISEGLKYFISDRLGEFILCIKNDLYVKEKAKVKDFFNKYPNKICAELSRNTGVPVSFFEENPDDIFWPYLCDNTSIPIEFFKKHLSDVNWGNLCKNTSIPAEFFTEYIDKVEWKFICENSSIPINFFKEHIDKIDWKSICKNTCIPIEFLNEYSNKISNWDFVCKNTFITLKFARELANKITKEGWSSLCLNPSIPIEFIEENLDTINKYFLWTELCLNTSIPVKFYKKHIDKLNWHKLCTNPSVPLEFFKEHIDEIKWEFLCRNPSIPLEFFKDNLDKVKWSSLCKNPSIPFEFLEEHLQEIKDARAYSELVDSPSMPIEYLDKNTHLLSICYIPFFEPFGIPKKIENFLKEIDPILNDKYIQINSIIMYCLRLLDDSLKNIERIQKMCINEYPLISNTISCLPKNEYFYSQIKHFLCTLKDGNNYKEELLKLCKGEEKKEKEEKEEKDTFIINIYDMKNPIQTMNNSDKIEIYDNNKTITLIKEDDVFQNIDSLDFYDMNDIFRFQGVKAYIIKGKNKTDIEEKQRETLAIEYRKNVALRNIYKQLNKEIPELTFKMFNEAYNNMYSDKNPLTLTEKEMNSMFHRVIKYMKLKKIDLTTSLRAKKEEKKEELPINPNMYDVLSTRISALRVDEFNNAYRLIVDLFDADMTYNDKLQLLENHIYEIRNAR